MKRKYFARHKWQGIVNPAFVRYWAAQKRLRLAGAGDEKQAFLKASTASRLFAVERLENKNSIYARVWAEIIRPLDGEAWPHSGEVGKAYAVNPEASAFFRDLVFLRFGKSFRELITQAEKDPAAHRMLLRVHRDYYRFRWEGGFENLRLKFNLDHFSLIAQGMDFGLDQLNELELVACLNAICPCDQRHSPEFLKKLRASIKKACERLIRSADKPTSFEVPSD
jgi:hypothetical protein